MKARDYTKRIDIYEYSETADGFGGNTVSKTLLESAWARLSNKSGAISQRSTALGLSDLIEPLIFMIRFRNDLAYNGRILSLEYNGNEYVIHSIVDVDMMHRELEIVCSRKNPETFS